MAGSRIYLIYRGYIEFIADIFQISRIKPSNPRIYWILPRISLGCDNQIRFLAKKMQQKHSFLKVLKGIISIME